MKRYFALILTILFLFGLVGCQEKTYQFAWDGFCYIVEEHGFHSEFELATEDKKYILKLMNDASWEEEVSTCEHDFVFYTQRQQVRYCSECGTFYDVTNLRSVTLSADEHRKVNNMLLKSNEAKKKECLYTEIWK